MTKAEFIRRYFDASNLGSEFQITEIGILAPDWEFVAVPCHCGWERCLGWEMFTVERKNGPLTSSTDQPNLSA